jgi:type I restriction enzyme S subunit
MRTDVITDTEWKITKDAVASSATNIIPGGNVVIATRVGLGKVCLLAQDTAINQDLRGVIPIDPAGLSARFLFWWLRSIADILVAEGTGATVQGIKLPFVRGLAVPVPSPAEQERIVDILDAAFAGSEAATATAEENLKNTRTLFESHLQAVFAERGERWVDDRIGSLCTVKHGFAFDGAEFSRDVPEGNPLIITPGNFTEDGRLSFNRKNAKRFNGDPPAGFLLDKGDLAVVMTDLSARMRILGKPAFVETSDVLHNQRIGRVVFTDDRIEKRWLYYFMMSDAYLRNIRASATGTMVKHTAPKRILSNVIPFPASRSEQRAIIGRLDALRDETQRLESLYHRKLVALERLRQSLLHLAFTGHL